MAITDFSQKKAIIIYYTSLIWIYTNSFCFIFCFSVSGYWKPSRAQTFYW